MVKYIATKREGDVIVANFEEQKSKQGYIWQWIRLQLYNN